MRAERGGERGTHVQIPEGGNLLATEEKGEKESMLSLLRNK